MNNTQFMNVVDENLQQHSDRLDLGHNLIILCTHNRQYHFPSCYSNNCPSLLLRNLVCTTLFIVHWSSYTA
uniref:Uncharacterized protein n=1 Tax=Hordeum vulgare subsp. vulgare TaxID=112509 RepID=A0A8I6WLW6_HORVV